MRFIVLLITALVTLSANASLTLVCSDKDPRDAFYIIGVGSKAIQLRAKGSHAAEEAWGSVPRTVDGDCAGRRSLCYQDGQFMVNIPRSLVAGLRKTGRVWVNSDTDDRPENHRLGDDYVCTIER